jgi:hypothetical protein
MAQVTDLTYQELNNVAIADPNIGVAVFSLVGDSVMLDIKKLTGDSFTSLTETNFLEVMYKLRKLAGDTQKVVNATIAVTEEEELICFPDVSFSGISDGAIQVTQTQEFIIPLVANIVNSI